MRELSRSSGAGAYISMPSPDRISPSIARAEEHPPQVMLTISANPKTESVKETDYSLK